MLNRAEKRIFHHASRAQHSKPVQNQIPINRRAVIGLIALALFPVQVDGQTLSNNAFNIQYSARGITSLKRANDKYDTDYLSAGGSLGNIVIQYRTSTNNGWTTAREVGPSAAASTSGNAISYSIGTLLPTLPQLSTVSTSANGTNETSLSDGQVPPTATPGGRRGRGAGARGGRGFALPAVSPAFTWPGERGTTQWVQYTFSNEQEVSTVQVHWATEDTNSVRVPVSW